MKDLKFRAWDKISNEMIYSGIEYQKRTSKNPKHGKNNAWGSDTIGFINNNEEQFDLMQYTGLKDKNGKEIFESYIVEFDINEWGGDDNIHVVTWDDKEACWCWGGGSTLDMEFRTVIGNIHQNPELIK